MAEQDCGELPVLDGTGSPIGVITGRDIACRAVAQGRSVDAPVREIMSTPVITAKPDINLEDGRKALEENQIRRMPVVEDDGSFCGMISQADITQHAPDQVAQVVRNVSAADIGSVAGRLLLKTRLMPKVGRSFSATH